MPEPMHPSMRELYERLGRCIAEHPAYADEEVLVHVVEDNLPAGVEALAAIFASDFEPGSVPLIIAYLDRGPADAEEPR